MTHRPGALRTARLLTLLVLVCASAAASAQQLSAHTPTPSVQAQQAGQKQLLINGPLRIDDALLAAPTAWQPASPTSHGVRAGSVWLHLRLPPARLARVVTIDNPLLDELQFHLRAADSPTLLKSIYTGAATPFNTRPMQADSEFSFPIEASVQALDVFIGTRSASALRVNATLRTADDYAQHAMLTTLLHGACYGALLVMALYNIGLALSLRDRIYAIYVGYVFSTLSLVMALDGTTYRLLASLAPQSQVYALIVSAHLAIGFLQFFVRDFLKVAPGSLLYRWLTVLGYANFLATLTPVFGYGPHSYLLLLLLGSVSSIPPIAAPVLLWRQSSGAARLYSAGLLIVLTGSITYAAMQFGLIEPSIWAKHGVQIGSTLDVVLLSFALATRIRHERHARERTEADAQALALRLESVQRERELAAKDKALQDSLQRARQLQVLGQMAGGFAHGFNNILTSMMGFAELAQERTADSRDEITRRHLAEIQNGGRRAARLVDQLLTYSGGNKRLASSVDLVEVVDRAVSLLRPTLPRQTHLLWNPPTRPAITRLDPDRMQQAIINLCLNASDAIADSLNYKASPVASLAADGTLDHNEDSSQTTRDEHADGGAICLQLTSRTLDDTVCTSCAATFKGSFHVLQVRDNGAGIEGDLAQIFVPFYTTRPADNSGLGLSVVHAVTHECGGHLCLRNHPAGGAEFEIYLPT